MLLKLSKDDTAEKTLTKCSYRRTKFDECFVRVVEVYPYFRGFARIVEVLKSNLLSEPEDLPRSIAGSHLQT